MSDFYPDHYIQYNCPVAWNNTYPARNTTHIPEMPKYDPQIDDKHAHHSAPDNYS